jgi:apolipoprotein D and lipocalin family protein
VLEPLDFLRRLAALIPAPHAHTVRYHDVFANHARASSPTTPGPARCGFDGDPGLPLRPARGREDPAPSAAAYGAATLSEVVGHARLQQRCAHGQRNGAPNGLERPPCHWPCEGLPERPNDRIQGSGSITIGNAGREREPFGPWIASPIDCYDGRMHRRGQIRVAGLCAAACLTFLCLPREASSEEDTLPHVTPVARVDLDRYAGTWYEVAKIPNRFQKGCARGTTAEYSLRDDGRIAVVNRCYRDNGGLDEAKGVARIEDPASNAKLKVSFVSFLGWRPFWGDYWIIGLEEDYRWAIVATPDRKYGWILSRTPTLSEHDLAEAFAIIERNGYRRDAFEMSQP